MSVAMLAVMGSVRTAIAIVIVALLLPARWSAADTLSLTWDTPAYGVTAGYVLRYGTTPGTYSNAMDVGLTTNTSVSSLSSGTTYYFAVQAYSAEREFGELSSELTATIAPAAPSNFSAAIRDGRFLDLTWQAPSGTSSGYRLEVGTTAGASNVSTIATGTATTFTINDLSAGTYYIRARSVNAGGVSAPGNEVVVTLVVAPSPPTSLSATVRNRRIVDLAWQAPGSGATSYRIEVGTATGQSNVRTGTTVGTSLTIDGLSSGTYYIRVRSGNDASLSAPSNEVVAEVAQGGRPAKPRTLTATITDRKSIDLTWEAGDEEVVSYRVEVGTVAAATNVSSFTTGATTSFSISELPPDTYYIRVRSVSEDGVSEPSNEVAVSQPGASDAPRRLSAAVIDGDVLHLEWEAPQNSSDVTGYVIEAGAGPGRTDVGRVTAGGLEFTSPHVPDGTYFLRVRSMKATGPGPASNEVVAHVGARPTCTQPPSRPSILATVVNGFVELSWSAGAGDAPTGYVLDVGSARGRRDITTMPLAADVTALRARAPNGTYALRLTAVNACGGSALAADTFATVGGPELTVPGAPVGLTPQVTGRSARLTWSAPVTGGTADRYVIDVLSGGDQLLLSLDTGNLSTVFTHGDAPPGVYTVRVRAVNAVGAGASSNAITVTIR